MGKIKENIIKGLQLDHKWVRVMLLISVVLVIGVFFYPTMKTKEIAYSLNTEKPLMDTTFMQNDSTRTRVLIRRQPINVHMPLAVPPANSIGDEKSLGDKVDSAVAAKSEPIQVQIVEATKPFDWKGTATWMIGAINGLVLLVLNLKNILKKTP